MLKKFILITLFIFLAGCSSAPVILYKGSNKKPTDIATITTNCNSICKSKISEQLGFDSRYQMDRGLLLEVNGKEGTWKVSKGKAFNSSLNAAVNVKVDKGETELLIDHNSRLVVDDPERFKVNLLGGHIYIIGRIRVEVIEQLQYRWFPVIFDQTSGKVIYANDKYFSESAKLTCIRRKKTESYCSCFSKILNRELSYKDKESVILNTDSAFKSVLNILTKNEKEIANCPK